MIYLFYTTVDVQYIFAQVDYVNDFDGLVNIIYKEMIIMRLSAEV